MDGLFLCLNFNINKISKYKFLYLPHFKYIDFAVFRIWVLCLLGKCVFEMPINYKNDKKIITVYSKLMLSDVVLVNTIFSISH